MGPASIAVTSSSTGVVPTTIFSVPMARREVTDARRRGHVRRLLSLLEIPKVLDIPDIPQVPGINIDLRDIDTEDEEEKEEKKDDDKVKEELTSDDNPAPAPPVAAPAAPPPSPPPPGTQPAVPPANAATSLPPSSAIAGSGLASPTPPLATMTVTAIAESLPTSTRSITRPIFITESRPPRPSFTDALDDDDDDSSSPSTIVTSTSTPASISSLIPTSLTTASATTLTSPPALTPTDPSLSMTNNDASGPNRESRVAIHTAVSIISIAIFIGIIYMLFHLCPPVRAWWITFKQGRRRERGKRMGVEGDDDERESEGERQTRRYQLPRYTYRHRNPHPNPHPHPHPLSQHPNQTHRPPTYLTDASNPRNISVENGVPRHLDEAHLRPPSYRSHWTASGASWVANGFRVPVERVSQRMQSLRWSRGRSGSSGVDGGVGGGFGGTAFGGRARSWFMGRGQRISGDSDGESGRESGKGNGNITGTHSTRTNMSMRTSPGGTTGGLVADGFRPAQLSALPPLPLPLHLSTPLPLQLPTLPPTPATPDQAPRLSGMSEVSRMPAGWTEVEVSRMSRTTAGRSSTSRISAVSRSDGLFEGTRRASGGSASASVNGSSSGGDSGKGGGSGIRSSPSIHSEAAFSTNARISDMSSLSAGTTSNAFRPVPRLRVGGGGGGEC